MHNSWEGNRVNRTMEGKIFFFPYILLYLLHFVSYMWVIYSNKQRWFHRAEGATVFWWGLNKIWFQTWALNCKCDLRWVVWPLIVVVVQLCPTLCDPMNWSMPGFPVFHYLSEFTQTHVHWVSDAIQPINPLLPLSSPTLSLSQHQGLFQWVGSSHQIAKVLEIQLQHQSFHIMDICQLTTVMC